MVRIDGAAAVDWFALEIQAVYFSGDEAATESREYLTSRAVPEVHGRRRPDFRSSSAKRLLPQLEVKVPTLTRWGKKLVVVTDVPFLKSMPAIRQANDLSNADICWLAYRLEPVDASRFTLILDTSLTATLRDVRASLVGGLAPPKVDFETRLAKRLRKVHGITAEFAKNS